MDLLTIRELYKDQEKYLDQGDYHWGWQEVSVIPRLLDLS